MWYYTLELTGTLVDSENETNHEVQAEVLITANSAQAAVDKFAQVLREVAPDIVWKMKPIIVY